MSGLDTITTLTDESSEDEDTVPLSTSAVQYTVPLKRQRSAYSLGASSGTQDDLSDDDDPPQKRQRPSDSPQPNSDNQADYNQDDSSEDDDPTLLHQKPEASMFSLPMVSDSQDFGGSADHHPHEDDFEAQSSDDEHPAFTNSDGDLMKRLVKPAKQSTYVDHRAQRMMEKMGYKKGHGLGKNAQGRVEPINVSQQRGRRGLGLYIKGLEAATLEWDSKLEVVSVKEAVKWLEDVSENVLSEEELRTWPREGKKKLTINDENQFCDPMLLKNVLSSKSVFDNLEPEELRKARTRSNPFETIRGGMFLNRAAMKMANMDKVFDFMFTDPKDDLDGSLVKPNELLYFADVCAGPGGFSEYVLWRKKWQTKGFGFTLKEQNDFRLCDFYAGPCETFETHYGAKGDGNVFDPDNINCFASYVKEQTNRLGVHFMMADGGFSVDGQENIQEILSKQLYLCQFLVALSIVRVGGHFVCKLFDLFTPFSVGLVYLMYKAFSKISIHKPNTSRPANSERYIICKSKRQHTEPIRKYMFDINKKLWKFGDVSDQDVTDIVPLDILKSDTTFYEYIIESNNRLGERQVVNLVKIAAFCRDVNLTEPQQADMRRECLKYWDVPDKARTAPPRAVAGAKCDDILNRCKMNNSILSASEKELTPLQLSKTFKSIYDWHCMVLGSSRERKNCTFFVGLGRSNVYMLENGRWKKVEQNIELSPDTLLYGELAEELRGEGRSQLKMFSLHIIDAICLGGQDISQLHITKRLSLCSKFCRALNKPAHTEMISIKVKELFDLEDVYRVFERLDMRATKGSGGSKALVFDLNGDQSVFQRPGALLFFKATEEPWVRHLSRSSGYKYYFHPHYPNNSLYDADRPEKACANFMSCFKSRAVWWWEEGVQVHDSHQNVDLEKLQRFHLLDIIPKQNTHR